MPAWPRRGGTWGQRPAEGGGPAWRGGGIHITAPNPWNASAQLTSCWCCVYQSCSALSNGPAVPCPSVLLCSVHQSCCAMSIGRTVPCLSVPLCPLCTQPGAAGGPAGKPLTGLLRRGEMVLHSRQRPRWRSVLGGSHGRHFGPAARTGAGRCCSGAVAALTPQHSPQRW